MAQTAVAFPSAGSSSRVAAGAVRSPRYLPKVETRTLLPTPDSDEVAMAIGRDHARHGLVPAARWLWPGHPVRQGWEAGRQRWVGRTLRATPGVRQWLALRLQAWQSGWVFDDLQVTPHYLAQLRPEVCPVTRVPLGEGGPDAEPVVVRVQPAAGFAAGNLAVLSRRAAAAKAELRWDEARQQADRAQLSPTGEVDGLDAKAWHRLAGLIALVTPLPHALAAQVPMGVLPSNRLRVLNPIQGVQALVTLQLTKPGYAARIARLSSSLSGATLRRDFQLFFHGLLPRALESAHATDGRIVRQRLEDAWLQALVQRRWHRFASALDVEATQRLLQRAIDLGLPGQRVEMLGFEQATETWFPHGLRPRAQSPEAPIVIAGTRR